MEGVIASDSGCIRKRKSLHTTPRDCVVYQCLRAVPLNQAITDHLLARALVLAGYAESNTKNAIHIAAYRFNKTEASLLIERVRGVGYRLRVR